MAGVAIHPDTCTDRVGKSHLGPAITDMNLGSSNCRHSAEEWLLLECCAHGILYGCVLSDMSGVSTPPYIYELSELGTLHTAPDY